MGISIVTYSFGNRLCTDMRDDQENVTSGPATRHTRHNSKGSLGGCALEKRVKEILPKQSHLSKKATQELLITIRRMRNPSCQEAENASNVSFSFFISLQELNRLMLFAQDPDFSHSTCKRCDIFEPLDQYMQLSGLQKAAACCFSRDFSNSSFHSPRDYEIEVYIFFLSISWLT